jgi:nicotinamidase/pyrazinamidase
MDEAQSPIMKTVFFDIDTQLDFLVPAGALYVPGAEDLIPQIFALHQYASAHQIPVISSMDAHAENDPEFQQWPHHCVKGTWGQQKAAATLFSKRAVVPNVPMDLSDALSAEQILLEKDQLDIFKTPNIAELLGRLNADEYVVYGVVTEICVWLALEGLLRTGKTVTVLSDAIQSLSVENSHRVLSTYCSRGGKVSTVLERTSNG